MIFVRNLLVTLACLLCASGAFAQGKWARLAPFPEPSEELLGASAGGKMYVLCGLAPGWVPKALVYEYDPAADKWTKKKPMALPSHHVAFTEYRGKIYAFGGFVLPQSGPAAWVPINNAWEYDPATDNWKALAPMPTPRNHATAGAVNGKAYVIGGRVGAAFSGGSSNIGATEAYDPATDSWSQGLARMPTARSAGAAGVYGGRVYVTGGEYQDYRMMATLRSFEAYDPATNTWQTLPSLPVSRHGLAGAVVGNRLHMVSGDVQSAGTGVHVHTESHDAYELDGGKK